MCVCVCYINLPKSPRRMNQNLDRKLAIKNIETQFSIYFLFYSMAEKAQVELQANTKASLFLWFCFSTPGALLSLLSRLLLLSLLLPAPPRGGDEGRHGTSKKRKSGAVEMRERDRVPVRETECQ